MSNANQGHEVHTGAQGKALTCSMVDVESGKMRKTRARFVPQRLSDAGKVEALRTKMGRLETRAAGARFLFIDQPTMGQRFYIDSIQPVRDACVGNSIGLNESPENARWPRAFPDRGLTSITIQAPQVGGGAACEKPGLEAIVLSE